MTQMPMISIGSAMATRIGHAIGSGSRFDAITRGVLDFRDLYFKSGIFGAEPWSEEMRKEIEQTARENIEFAEFSLKLFDDVVLANPPFGGKERKEVQQNFPIRTGETGSQAI